MGSGEVTRASRTHLRTLGVLFAGLVAGLLIAIATVGTLAYTATLEFCALSCHEMTIPYEAYRGSAHYAGRSGVRAVCVDCHIPPGFPENLTVKATRTVVDVWMHVVDPMDTPAKFEAHRYAMASREWARMKAGDSAECRACHQEMNPGRQSAAAQAVHASMAKGNTCIDCHAGIVHGKPSAPQPAAAR